jgi:cadherin 18 type 2
MRFSSRCCCSILVFYFNFQLFNLLDVPPVIEVSIKPQRLQSHDVGDFINNKLREIDHDPSLPPYDSIQEYAYEGEGSNMSLSLSSINTLANDQTENDETPKSDEDELDLDYLNKLGPKFTHLYDIYNGSVAKTETDNNNKT